MFALVLALGQGVMYTLGDLLGGTFMHLMARQSKWIVLAICIMIFYRMVMNTLKNYLKNGGSKVYSVEDLFNEHYAIILRGAKKEYVRKYEAVRDMFYMVVNRGQIGVTNANVLDFQREVYSRYE